MIVKILGRSSTILCWQRIINDNTLQMFYNLALEKNYNNGCDTAWLKFCNLVLANHM